MISAEDKRELKARQSLYPRWLKLDDAVRRIAIMEAIVSDDEQLVGGRLL